MKKFILLSSLMSLSLLATIPIASCRNQIVTTQSLDEEIKRLNNFIYTPKMPAFSIKTVLSDTPQNSLSDKFLPTFIKNWEPNINFSYWAQKTKDPFIEETYRTEYFKIFVQDNNSSSQSATTNDFSIKYQIQEEIDIREAVDNIKLIKTQNY